jgi:hypothetical protein
MITNGLSSFDEFNGISSCLHKQLDFCHNCQKKKRKLPLDFCHNCQKNENSLGSKYFPREKMLYFCHDVDIREVDFYSRS